MHRGASRAIALATLTFVRAPCLEAPSLADGTLAAANVPTERCAQRLVDYLRDKLEE